MNQQIFCGVFLVINKYEDFTEMVMTSYRAIQKIKSSGMKKIGLRAGDVNCIYYLSKYPEGLSNVQLSELSGNDKAAISRSCNFLVLKGFVEMAAEDDQKKYGRRYVLTEKGREAAERINQKVELVVNEVEKDVNIDEGRIFYETFRTIANKLEELSENYDQF